MRAQQPSSLHGTEREAPHGVPNRPAGIGAAFLSFLRTEKKWWLWPIIIVLLLLGALLVFTNGSAIAPFLYQDLGR